MDEAKLDETPYGRNPAEEGWFVLNLGTRSRCATRRRAARRIRSSRREGRSRASASTCMSSGHWPGDFVPVRLPWPVE